jgi:hypothetical protein
VIAQATATSANLLPGRFRFAVGTGEAVERAHPRRPLTGRRRPPGHAHRGDRRDPLAVASPTARTRERYLEAVKAYADAGFDDVAVTQIGPDQDGFLDLDERELHGRLALPRK